MLTQHFSVSAPAGSDVVPTPSLIPDTKSPAPNFEQLTMPFVSLSEPPLMIASLQSSDEPFTYAVSFYLVIGVAGKVKR